MTEIVVHVTDALDGEAVDKLDAALAEAIRRRPARLVVDLGRCPRISAAAIGLLVDTHRQMLQAYGVLRLRNARERVLRTLRLARVDQVLETEEPGILADVR